MPYYRADLDSGTEHYAVFAEATPTGEVVQHFALTIDVTNPRDDNARLASLGDEAGRILVRIDPALGWKRITPEAYEEATEIKRAIYLRDQAAGRASGPAVCAGCGGRGRQATTGKVCPACFGTGKV